LENGSSVINCITILGGVLFKKLPIRGDFNWQVFMFKKTKNVEV
jgi:hypothetical protein